MHRPTHVTHIARFRHQQAAVIVYHVAREAFPGCQQHQRRGDVAEVDEGVAGAAGGEGQHLEGGQAAGLARVKYHFVDSNGIVTFNKGAGSGDGGRCRFKYDRRAPGLRQAYNALGLLCLEKGQGDPP